VCFSKVNPSLGNLAINPEQIRSTEKSSPVQKRFSAPCLTSMAIHPDSHADKENPKPHPINGPGAFGDANPFSKETSLKDSLSEQIRDQTKKKNASDKAHRFLLSAKSSDTSKLPPESVFPTETPTSVGILATELVETCTNRMVKVHTTSSVLDHLAVGVETHWTPQTLRKIAPV
jgi:hypothetical protein